MQVDYVDENTPLLFMDFYLDMEIDEDNVLENLADDVRKDFTIECNVQQITGMIKHKGIIEPKVYHKNNIVSNPRMEYFSSDEDVVSVDDKGRYILKNHGNAVIRVNILGNDKTTVIIPVTVSNDITVGYNIIVSPIVTSLRQGLSTTIQAKIVDNTNAEIVDTIILTPSGADSSNNYSIVDNGNNSWTLTNKLKSKTPLTLTFSNTTYNVEYTMNIQLKAMF
jgi:hypothetical protein